MPVTGINPVVKTGIAAARTNLEVAQMIYDARTKAGLSTKSIRRLCCAEERGSSPARAEARPPSTGRHTMAMLN